MAGDDLETAVRRVLPVLNLEPATFELDRGFVARASGRSRPSVAALNSLANQLVFVGTLGATNLDAVAERVAGEALEVLPELSRRACERLIVAWQDPKGEAFAAAYSVTPNGGLGRLLGSSWTRPESWPDPMIDAFKSGDEILNDALERLESIVEARRATPDANAMLDRSFRLVDLALQRHGGEGQHVSDHPDIGSSDAAWSSWLDRYERSVRDEWRRIRGGHPERVAVMEPTAEGPLSGMRIFLSYARPDTTELARPVFSALRSYGAYVWFDQEEPLEKGWLDVGLAEKIGECDAYVMCASDEFIERAGYATQEVAWAVRQAEAEARTRHFLVVARPGTVLPTIVAGWPSVELRGQDPEDLAPLLAAHLRTPVTFTLPGPRPDRAGTPVEPPLPPREADLDAMRSRVRHMRRFDEIDQASIEALISETADTRRTAEVRGHLRGVGEGLDWSGTLSDLDHWPEDSFVRDYRWRLACLRAVVSSVRPLSGDFHEPDDIARDVKYIATRPIPVLDWSNVPGRGDNERRLTLRHHAGTLRLLQQALSRGLYGGLLSVPSSTLQAWEAELPQRRRECVDALMTLRVQGLLSWKGEPPTWDLLFRRWSKLMTASGGSWSEPVPAEVRLTLSSNADDVAAVAAQTTWYAAQYGGPVLQTFRLRNSFAPTTMDIWAAGPAATRPEEVTETGRRLQLGLEATADGGASVQLSWAEFSAATFSADPAASMAAGRTSQAAPEELRQALSFSRS